jgi:hypothetical protein
MSHLTSQFILLFNLILFLDSTIYLNLNHYTLLKGNIIITKKHRAVEQNDIEWLKSFLDGPFSSFYYEFKHKNKKITLLRLQSCLL